MSSFRGDDDGFESYLGSSSYQNINYENSSSFQNNEINNTEIKRQSNGLSEKQIQESLKNLSALHQQSHTLITKIRLESDNEENERRINQEVSLDNIKRELEMESEDSERKNAAVAMKWPSIMNVDIPQEIHAMLLEQQRDCEIIISKKNRLISILQEALEKKDHEYVSALRKQAKDMDILTERMAQQIKILSQSYEKELDQIELAFQQEREDFIKSNNQELEQLKEERRNKEKKFVEDRITQVSQNEKELSDLRDKEMEKYAETKKAKDEKVHELERSIDYMRAKYELYSEKLKYYHNVLFERVEENKTAIRNNKSILAKLQDQLSGIKAKYAKDDNKFKQENHETTEQYKRMAKQYKDLLVKFKYFEKADTQKYRDVWRMNEQIVTELADKLLKADKIISEQILGQTWIPPSNDIFKSPLEITTQSGFLSNTAASGFNKDEFSETGGSFREGSKSLLKDGKENRDTNRDFDNMSENTGISTNSNLQKTGNTLPNSVKRSILEHLCDASGFLVEDRVRSILSQLESEEEKHLLKIDSILHAIGIQSNDDIDKLITFLAQHIENFDIITDETDEDIRKRVLGTELNSDYVIKLLSQFIEDQQTFVTQTKASKPKMISIQERNRNLQRQEERDYWKRLQNVIPDTSFRVWKSLENAQSSYGKLLNDREKLIEETEMIRMQNNELRELLKQYLTNQKINEELFVPPRFDVQ